MKITVAGCGNAFPDDNFNQSFIVEENGRTMLVDCGYQVPLALRVNRIDFRSIDDIYISHLHADHLGGLEYFAFQRYDWVNKPRIAPEGPGHSRFKFGSGVHADYAQLAGYPSANSIKIDDEIKAKMWLGHSQDFVPKGRDMYGNDVGWDREIAADGFAGRVKMGQVFEI